MFRFNVPHSIMVVCFQEHRGGDRRVRRIDIVMIHLKESKLSSKLQKIVDCGLFQQVTNPLYESGVEVEERSAN